jgi:hypothetical protein
VLAARASTSSFRPRTFIGSHEPAGWKLAERLTPLTYVARSLWLIATGVALLA